MIRNDELCAAIGDIEKLKEAIKKWKNVNVYNRVHRTPISYAAAYNRLDELNLLIEHGAWINRTSETDPNVCGSPLYWACSAGHTEIAKLLIEKGANINEGAFGNTPLHTAVQDDRPECVALLLSKGANVFAVNSHLETPMHVAAIYGQSECAKLLLKNADGGLTLKMKNLRHETPKDLALMRAKESSEPKYFEFLSLISEYEIKGELGITLSEKVKMLEQEVRKLQDSLFEIRELHASLCAARDLPKAPNNPKASSTFF